MGSPRPGRGRVLKGERRPGRRHSLLYAVYLLDARGPIDNPKAFHNVMGVRSLTKAATPGLAPDNEPKLRATPTLTVSPRRRTLETGRKRLDEQVYSS